MLHTTLATRFNINALELPFLVPNKDIPSLEKCSYFFMGGNYTPPPVIILGGNYPPTKNRGKYPENNQTVC